MKHAKRLILALLAGIFIMPAPSYADDAETKKPPIIVKQGNKTYVFTQQDEKFRSILLNSKRLRIKQRDDRNDYYDRDYYRHHKYVRDHENMDKKPSKRDRDEDKRDAAYYSGYSTGYALENDRNYRD